MIENTVNKTESWFDIQLFFTFFCVTLCARVAQSVER